MVWSRREFVLASGAALGVAAIPGCSLPTKPAPALPPATPAPTGFPLIGDMASRLDATKAKAIRALGVRTVFRYYSHLPPSLPGKDLQPEETKIILGEGLSIGAVFQHYNNCFRTFEGRWGREDAEQALRMAEAVKQPEGSAIYFGVDADWPYLAMRDPITTYFEDVNRAFEGSNLAVGIYSNGCICNAIREKGLAAYFWLSGSTGHSGTQAFYNTGKWTLFQNALDIVPAPIGFAIDANLANPATEGYFGQWSEGGARIASHPPADVRAVFTSRAFLSRNADVKTVADPLSESLITLRKDQNVRRLADVNGWTQVLTQEGGSKASAPPLTGWLPASVLAPLDGFPDAAGYGLCGASTPVSDTFKYQNCERAVSRLR